MRLSFVLSSLFVFGCSKKVNHVPVIVDVVES